jgi:hypothetical protein
LGGPNAPTSGIQPAQGFLLEIDAALNQILLSTYGYGGGLIALDAQSNIYLTGSAQPFSPNGSSTTPLQLPQLPANAFQPTHAADFCTIFGSGPGGRGAEQACLYQYVAKLTPGGTLIWATYVTGSYGAIAYGMTVDSSGNVIVAGTTNSDDYPVTDGAFQTSYTEGAAYAPQIPANPSNASGPPPAIGFVTSKFHGHGPDLVDVFRRLLHGLDYGHGGGDQRRHCDCGRVRPRLTFLASRTRPTRVALRQTRCCAS